MNKSVEAQITIKQRKGAGISMENIGDIRCIAFS